MDSYYDTLKFMMTATVALVISVLLAAFVGKIVFKMLRSIAVNLIRLILFFLRRHVFLPVSRFSRTVFGFAGDCARFLIGAVVSSGERTGRFLRKVLDFLGNRGSDRESASGRQRTVWDSAAREEAVFKAVMRLAGHAAAADPASRGGAEAAAREIARALNGGNRAAAGYMRAFGMGSDPRYRPEIDTGIILGAVPGGEARAAVISCLAYAAAAGAGIASAQRRRVAEIARRLGLGEARINAVFAEFDSGRDERYERNGRDERSGGDDRYERNGSDGGSGGDYRNERNGSDGGSGGRDERYERNGRDGGSGRNDRRERNGRDERNGGGSGSGGRIETYAEAMRFFGLSEDAGEEEIKKTYLRLIRQYHPDRAGRPDAPDLSKDRLEEMTGKINAAYDLILSLRGR